MQYTYTAVITEKDGTFYAKVPDVDGVLLQHRLWQRRLPLLQMH